MHVLVPWSADLSVGVDSIDEQHQKLVTLLNNLFAAVVALRGQRELVVVLKTMADYTVEHFLWEEEQMRTAGYPDLPRHRAEHHLFIDYVEGIQRRFALGDFVSSLEVLKYLRDWLTGHIQTLDKDFGRWTGSEGTL